METIAIIDDNEDEARTLAENLMGIFPDPEEITIKVYRPLGLGDYPSFLERENICGLILDEMLNDKPDKNGNSVDYQGSKLVSEIRKFNPSIPIMIITGWEISSSAAAVQGELECDIISRPQLGRAFQEPPLKAEAETTKIELIRFFRASRRHWGKIEADIDRLGDLASRNATEGLTSAEKKEMQTLQNKLSFGSIEVLSPERQNALDKFERTLIELEILIKKIEE